MYLNLHPGLYPMHAQCPFVLILLDFNYLLQLSTYLVRYVCIPALVRTQRHWFLVHSTLGVVVSLA